jgi:hypothetical protein
LDATLRSMVLQLFHSDTFDAPASIFRDRSRLSQVAFHAGIIGVFSVWHVVRYVGAQPLEPKSGVSWIKTHL